MDGLAIKEDDFARVTGVSRSTRKDWAQDGLVAPVGSPYELPRALEVAAFVALRTALADPALAAVAWRQLRPACRQAVDRRPAQVLVELRTGAAERLAGDEQITAFVRREGPVRLVDLTAELDVVRDGFALAAGAARRTHGRDGGR